MSALLVESRDAEASLSLAADVRTVAAEAHRLLGDPVAAPAELRRLCRRLARLREQLDGRPANPLARWAANLERLVDARLAACPC